MPATLVVHGHFYQPPRENPWTERVAVEPSARPYHDWNERITDECYRPNGHARIVDDFGRVVAVVDNYRHLSFNVGPTLLSWLETKAPDVYRTLVEADRATGGAIAQAYNHMILPLADDRDLRTQIRWGLADFRHRFGREATGMWLPETAVDDRVLAALAAEGVRFTILAPGQAAAVRDEPGADWIDVIDQAYDLTRPYRWTDPDDPTTGVDLVFYDGDLSHGIAFALGSGAAMRCVERAEAVDGGLVAVAADGETFGHHHRFGERSIAYALPVEAPRRGVPVANLSTWLAANRPTAEAKVRLSAWSCVHGVGRWQTDCGCSTGGEPGWNQAWRAPLRAALDVLRNGAKEVFERRGPAVLNDPWAARDAYVDVLIGATTADDFAAEWVTGDRVEAFTLLEVCRAAMLMYTSCGWFFNDLAGLETVQVLRYAARALDLLDDLDEPAERDGFFAHLAEAVSNDADEGDGLDIWRRHVVPARVPPSRVCAHAALVDALDAAGPATSLGNCTLRWHDHARLDRGALSLTTGRVDVTHRRTGRTTSWVVAALAMGGTEVAGACRPAADETTDLDDLRALRQSFADGTQVTGLLRLIGELLGTFAEFGIEAVLPDTPDLLDGIVRSLSERFLAAHARLYADHRATIRRIVAAGRRLPGPVWAAVQQGLSRALEAEVRDAGGSVDPGAYGRARELAAEARELGVSIDSAEARALVEPILVAGVTEAVGRLTPEAVDAVLELLSVVTSLGLQLDLTRAQEAVYVRQVVDPSPVLVPLAAALGLAETLGVPT